MTPPRFLPVGPRTVLVELPDLAATQAVFRALTQPPLDGIAEIIPAARTLLIRTEVGVPADGALAARIVARHPATPGATGPGGAEIEIPLRYDGPDLPEVARHMGLTEAEVIAAHQAATWQVAFCGFAPGFAYMTCDDLRFDLPRRSSPRTRIPAGSVALAGRFGGIYPQETPGGWQIIGTTEVPMWDLTRDPPALLQPGATVRFVARNEPHRPVIPPRPANPTPGIRVEEAAFPLVFQDLGRMGQGGQGVSTSGALDRGALRRANRAVGNPAGAAALEITLGPTRFRAERPLTAVLTGAVEGAHLTTPDGPVPLLPGQPFAMDAGDGLVLPPPLRGMRAYLALRGGYAVTPVLGSAATDTLAHIGPPTLRAGDGVGAGLNPAGSVIAYPEAAPALPMAGREVLLPVTLGPRTDWFPPEVVAQFLAQVWRVTPQSSRVGIRLEGDLPLLRPDAAELPSEGTERGALQVPHSGQPVLFLADHPLTGGYPVIATLHPDALDLAGQVPPGARLRFVADRAFAPILPTPPDPSLP